MWVKVESTKIMFVRVFHELGAGDIVIGEYPYFIVPKFPSSLGVGEMRRVYVFMVVEAVVKGQIR